MEVKNFRDYAIGIGCLILTGGLVFTVVWLLTKALPATQPIFHERYYISAFCEPIKTGYVLTVSIDNFSGKEDLKDVRCEMALKGDLSADPEQQSIGDIPKGGRNDCFFLLRGDYEGPVSARVKFNDKSISAGSVCRQSVPVVEELNWATEPAPERE